MAASPVQMLKTPPSNHQLMKAALEATLASLPLPATAKWPAGVWDREVIRHGTMSVSLFAPRGHDYQTPHAQDELYFIARGSATLVARAAGGVQSRNACRPGDVLFVAAGEEHRFQDLSDDFASWVVFWGPNGGEAAASSTDAAPVMIPASAPLD